MAMLLAVKECNIDGDGSILWKSAMEVEVLVKGCHGSITHNEKVQWK